MARRGPRGQFVPGETTSQTPAEKFVITLRERIRAFEGSETLISAADSYASKYEEVKYLNPDILAATIYYLKEGVLGDGHDIDFSPSSKYYHILIPKVTASSSRQKKESNPARIRMDIMRYIRFLKELQSPSSK